MTRTQHKGNWTWSGIKHSYGIAKKTPLVRTYHRLHGSCTRVPAWVWYTSCMIPGSRNPKGIVWPFTDFAQLKASKVFSLVVIIHLHLFTWFWNTWSDNLSQAQWVRLPGGHRQLRWANSAARAGHPGWWSAAAGSRTAPDGCRGSERSHS